MASKRPASPEFDTDEISEKKTKLDWGDKFKFVVGRQGSERTYNEPIKLLTKSSLFFQDACGNHPHKIKHKDIRLANTTPRVFDVYLQLLYSGYIMPTARSLKSLKPESKDFNDLWIEIYTMILDTYSLADQLIDKQSKNDLMDYLVDVTKTSKMFPCEARIYEQTAEHSPLRRMLVDWASATASFKDRMPNMPAPFAVDVATNLLNSRESKTEPIHPHTAHKCRYHEHDTNCPPCKKPGTGKTVKQK